METLEVAVERPGLQPHGARLSEIALRPSDGRLVYSVTEVAELLGISRAHGYDLVASGELPHLRLGRRIVVPKHALAQLLGADSSDASLSARRGGEQ